MADRPSSVSRRTVLRGAVGASLVPLIAGSASASEQASTPTREREPDYGEWFANVDNYHGETRDWRGTGKVTVTVGAEGNGGANAFSPPAIHVDAGTTVQFEWTGDGAHNVVARHGEFESGRVRDDAGVHYQHTFEADGIYEYYCDPHRAVGMKGAIVVGTDYPTTETTVEEQPVEWRYYTDPGGRSSPTVVDETVYVGAHQSVFALDATSGRALWEFPTGELVDAAPAVQNGTVYAGSKDATVYAIDADSGEEQWEYGTDGAVVSSPTVADGTVFVGSDDQRIYALDARSGDHRWDVETGHRVVSAPTVVEGTVFVGGLDDAVYALDAATGDERWSVKLPDAVAASSTVWRSLVVVGCTDGSVYALDADTGGQEWQFATADAVRSSPTVADGTVYVGSRDEHLYALDAASGERRWRYEASRGVDSSPTAVEDTVFVGTGGHAVLGIDAETGEEVWGHGLDGVVRSSPTVVDGTLYVTDTGGNVWALAVPVEGSSEGTRVLQRTLGHHGGTYDPHRGDPAEPTGTAPQGSEDSASANGTTTTNGTGPGFGVGAALAGLGGAAALARSRADTSDDER